MTEDEKAAVNRRLHQFVTGRADWGQHHWRRMGMTGDWCCRNQYPHSDVSCQAQKNTGVCNANVVDYFALENEGALRAALTKKGWLISFVPNWDGLQVHLEQGSPNGSVAPTLAEAAYAAIGGEE